MGNPSPLRAVQKDVLKTLTRIGDAEIPAALRKVRDALNQANLDDAQVEEAPKRTRRRRGGYDRQEKAGEEREE